MCGGNSSPAFEAGLLVVHTTQTHSFVEENQFSICYILSSLLQSTVQFLHYIYLQAVQYIQGEIQPKNIYL